MCFSFLPGSGLLCMIKHKIGREGLDSCAVEAPHGATSSPGRFSLALGAGRETPKPGKSALGTRLLMGERAGVDLTPLF